MNLTCIGSFKHKFDILGTCHHKTLYLSSVKISSVLSVLFQTMCGQRFTQPLSVAGCTVTHARTSVISLYCMKLAGGRNWPTFWLSLRTR